MPDETVYPASTVPRRAPEALWAGIQVAPCSCKESCHLGWDTPTCPPGMTQSPEQTTERPESRRRLRAQVVLATWYTSDYSISPGDAPCVPASGEESL